MSPDFIPNFFETPAFIRRAFAALVVMTFTIITIALSSTTPASAAATPTSTSPAYDWRWFTNRYSDIKQGTQPSPGIIVYWKGSSNTTPNPEYGLSISYVNSNRQTKTVTFKIKSWTVDGSNLKLSIYKDSAASNLNAPDNIIVAPPMRPSRAAVIQDPANTKDTSAKLVVSYFGQGGTYQSLTKAKLLATSSVSTTPNSDKRYYQLADGRLTSIDFSDPTQPLGKWTTLSLAVDPSGYVILSGSNKPRIESIPKGRTTTYNFIFGVKFVEDWSVIWKVSVDSPAISDFRYSCNTSPTCETPDATSADGKSASALASGSFTIAGKTYKVKARIATTSDEKKDTYTSNYSVKTKIFSLGGQSASVSLTGTIKDNVDGTGTGIFQFSSSGAISSLTVRYNYSDGTTKDVTLEPTTKNVSENQYTASTDGSTTTVTVTQKANYWLNKKKTGVNDPYITITQIAKTTVGTALYGANKNYDTSTLTLTFALPDRTKTNLSITGQLNRQATVYAYQGNSDVPTKTLTYVYSDPRITGLPDSKKTLIPGNTPALEFSADGSQRWKTYIFDDGENRKGHTSYGTVSAPTYSTEGANRYVSFSYSFRDEYGFGSGNSSVRTIPITAGSTLETINAGLTAADPYTKTVRYTYRIGNNPTDQTVSFTLTGFAAAPSYSPNADGTVTEFYNWSFNDNSTTRGDPKEQSVHASRKLYSTDHTSFQGYYVFSDGTNYLSLTSLTSTPTKITTPGYTPPGNAVAGWEDLGKDPRDLAPSTSSKITEYDDGYRTIEDGSKDRPFKQSTLAAPNASDDSVITRDPNANVITEGSNPKIYDLTWGSPDENGPKLYVPNFNAAAYTPAPFKLFGVGQISGSFVSPPPDVIAAWNQGWTGKYKKLIALDKFSEDDISSIYKTAALANIYAPAATLFGLDYSKSNPTLSTTSGVGVTAQSSTPISVITMGFSDPNMTSDLVTKIQNWVTLKDIGGYDLTDAMLVKAAGTSADGSSFDPLVRGLIATDLTKSRLVLVRALDDFGGAVPNGSNTTGPNDALRQRFLVTSGKSPFATDVTYKSITKSITFSKDDIDSAYAAARIAGYAAIIRHKFPKLTAVNTADILLSTARYDTLSCYHAGQGPTGSCSVSTYGQGEASLSRALAPVGYLR